MPMSCLPSVSTEGRTDLLISFDWGNQALKWHNPFTTACPAWVQSQVSPRTQHVTVDRGVTRSGRAHCGLCTCAIIPVRKGPFDPWRAAAGSSLAGLAESIWLFTPQCHRHNRIPVTELPPGLVVEVFSPHPPSTFTTWAIATNVVSVSAASCAENAGALCAERKRRIKNINKNFSHL